ncbi:unnamed protein product, partial [Nesidiocoris tenuis]
HPRDGRRDEVPPGGPGRESRHFERGDEKRHQRQRRGWNDSCLMGRQLRPARRATATCWTRVSFFFGK